MTWAITFLGVSVLMNVFATFAAYRCVRQRLISLQADVTAIRVRNVPPDLGGRLAPSPAELQAARNRMDKLGIAHPGGSS